MSIEQNISELTAAVRELTAVISASNSMITGGKTETVAAPKSTKPAATQAGADSQHIAKAAEAVVPEKKAEGSAEKSSGSTTTIDFAKQIQAPIVKMAGSGRREEALAILKQFGAARASEIKEENWAEAVAAIQAAG